MEAIRFEWDENKNHINQNKHKISFEEAKTVFYDEEALVIDDLSILNRRNGLLFSALAVRQICSSFVIAIANRTP